MKRSLITLAMLVVLAAPALGQTSTGTSNSGSYNSNNAGTTNTNDRNNNTSGTTNTSGTMNDNTKGTDNTSATTTGTTRHHRRHHRSARMASHHKKLPKTASPLPFLTLSGLGSLATGLWAGRRRGSQI